MPHDSKGIYIAPSRVIQTDVMLHEAGQLSAASKTALKAVPSDLRFEGMEAMVTADRSRWVFSAASTAADTTENLVLTPAVGTGRWLRADTSFHLKLAIAFGTLDAAVLFTVPALMRILVEQAFWEVTTSFTGGTNAAVGVSSDVAPHDTKGDILGGATGDVLATLVSTGGATKQGTAGASFTAAPKMVVLDAGSLVRYDLIASAFTAGAGFVHLACRRIS